MDHDPIHQFFPDEEDVDLYAVLGVTSAAKEEEIKKAYRKLALVHHPDKHATASEKAKADASIKFQQVGFAYAVLDDKKRKARYDSTGKTDEGFDLEGEDGWETYFEEMFERVTRGKLDEMKKQYQGSAEETEDLKQAYTETKGSLGQIMTHIPHSTHDDEQRFIIAITGLIAQGDLPSLPAWEKSSKDEKARLVRKKQADKEAGEAEALAKEVGVWDEFYGSGKAGPRRGKGKAKATEQEPADADGDDEYGDTSALQALMLQRRKKMDGFLDSLAEKYAEPVKGKKGKRTKRATEEELDEPAEESPKKRTKKAASSSASGKPAPRSKASGRKAR